jgi:mannose-6-phosphate isomerase-like protein (cupin superfamily)
MDKLTVAAALDAMALAKSNFARLLERPAFDVSLYRPEGTDPQMPHARDELYVIATGTGTFVCEGRSAPFAPGDVFFVAAGVEHRFTDFSADFSTWVIFIGERPKT